MAFNLAFLNILPFIFKNMIYGTHCFCRWKASQRYHPFSDYCVDTTSAQILIWVNPLRKGKVSKPQGPVSIDSEGAQK